MAYRPSNLVHTDEADPIESTASAREDGSMEPSASSSAEERPVHTGEVVGSNPSSRTISRDPGFVYFIFSDITECIKIGVAVDPWRRLDAFQTSCPEELGLVGYIQAGDAYALERQWHNRFYRERVRGEWFRFTDELWEAIQGESSSDFDRLAMLTGYDLRDDPPSLDRPQLPAGVVAPKGNSRRAKMDRYKLARGIA